jgi:glutathione S-transferase
MSDVQVIGLPQSNYVWAVRIALAEKGVDYENIPAPPHSPEAVAVHPMGKIPVLRHGGVALGESRAIIDYIDATFDGSPLVPVERDAALRSNTWTSIFATSIEPLLVRQYLFAYMVPGTVDGQPDRAVVEAVLPKVEAALDVVETALGSGAVGADPFGRVDAYLVPILFYVRNMPEGGPMIAARPHLSAYLDRSLARPSVQTTMPPPLPGRQ